ncbi:hypothetical protein KDL01_22230 [Actinospica durhamensis]|uniref:Uncharacterized protein n=1 Tax=Actinospica durhamensis TaxID=1508375 RepID=A0A941IP09_9ACTN|nr:hypothetical protein [Actinospica durhamensis]MBR7836010.1 hypothetical protein [Actinospica durhamensis]
MAGVLLLACGLLATVIGWRTVRRVRALTRRITGHYHGPQVPVWVRRVAPWRLIPGVGEAVIVWNRRAKLAKLLALPLLLLGPLLTALGALLLVHEVHTAHALRETLIQLAVFLAAAALVRGFLRRGRRPAVSPVSTRQDRL